MRDGSNRRQPFRVAYWLAVSVVFGTALYVRLTVPQTPFIDPDFGGYLKPALLALTGGHFQHLEGRSFVYPGFVYLVLRVFFDFKAIPVLQHFLGVAAGGFLLVCLNRSGTLIKTSQVPVRTYRLLGLGTASLFLLNTAAIRFEHQIRPEAVIPFFTILNIFLNIEFIDAWYRRIDRRKAILVAACCCFVGFLLFYLKAYFWLATVLSTIPICIVLFDRNVILSRKLLMFGVSAISVAALLVVPERQLGQTDSLSRTFVPATLFVIHANIIRDQIARDIEQGIDNPYSTESLRNTLHLLDAELLASKETKKYASLGFDPDYLMFRNSFCTKFETLFPVGDPSAQQTQFYYYYFFRAWTHQPGRMLAKIGRQLSIFYNPGHIRRSPYKANQCLLVNLYYQRNCELIVLAPYLLKMDYQPLQGFIRDSCELSTTEEKLFHPIVVHWAKHLLARTWSLTMVLFVGAAFVVLWNPIWRREYGLFVAVAALMFCYSFGTNLGLAIVHTLEVERYVTNQLIYCVLPQCMTLFLTSEIAYLLWKRRHHAENAPESSASTHSLPK